MLDVLIAILEILIVIGTFFVVSLCFLFFDLYDYLKNKYFKK